MKIWNQWSTVKPTEFPTVNPVSQLDTEVQGNLLREYEQKFADLPEQEKLSKLCCDASFKIVGKGQFFITLVVEERPDEMKNLCVESTFYLEVRKHPAWEGGFVETQKSAQSWMWKSAVLKDVTVWRSLSNLYFETEQFLGFASWTETTSTWPKRQKKFLLQALRTEVQGNLSRRPNHDQSRLLHCLLCLFFVVNETG